MIEEFSISLVPIFVPIAFAYFFQNSSNDLNFNFHFVRKKREEFTFKEKE